MGMISYLVVVVVGIILVLIFGLLSFFLTSPKIPNLPEARQGGNFESAGGVDAVGYSPQMIDEMRALFLEQNRQSFWKSIWVSSAFYFLGAITSAFGVNVAGLFQAMLG